MNVFELRDQLVKDYGAFARSFTKIKSADIHEQLKAIYEDDRFWPEPLLQINPNYKPGPTIAELSHNRELHPLCAEIIQIRDESTGDRTPLSLHTHQFQALSAGKSGASYVVTTGTGSGKSLCFFIPIIDAILREKEADATPRTRAVIVYPMNALANSQMEELEKFIQNVTPRPVTFARYTGQEDAGLREGIAGNPPDILLTNFVMLEYARAYGLTRDEWRYVIDPADVMGADYPSETFRVLKNNEMREFGEYRTARLVLAAWDGLESGGLQ